MKKYFSYLVLAVFIVSFVDYAAFALAVTTLKSTPATVVKKSVSAKPASKKKPVSKKKSISSQKKTSVKSTSKKKPSAQPAKKATPAPVTIQTVPTTTPVVVVPTTPVVAPVAPEPVAQYISPITIKGDQTCVQQTDDALQLLRDKAPTYYQFVLNNIGIIECEESGSGTFGWENPVRVIMGRPTRDAGTLWYAGVLAHESEHAQLYRNYAPQYPGQYVPDDLWGGYAGESAALGVQYDALKQLGADQSLLDYVKNSINTNYYNVPYDQRWW